MLTYDFFNMSKLRNLFALISYRATHNKIVNSIRQKGAEQILMPVNLNGVYNVSGTINFGLPIKRLEGGNFNIITSVDYNRNGSIINHFINYVKNLSVTEEVNLNYNYKENLDLSLNASIMYNSVIYTVDKIQNSSYFTYGYSIDASYTFSKGIIFLTNADYIAYTGRSGGFNPNYVIWNASVAMQLFKNKRGEIRLSVIDILNQNTNISRNINDNYIEDVQTTALKRFGLLTFTYNLSKVSE